MAKMRGEYKEPSGLLYYPNFLNEKEEKGLLSFLEELSYEQVIIYDQPSKRTVKHYGYNYDYEKVKLSPGEVLPEILQNLSHQCAEVANISPEKIVHCLISYYPPSSTIGWHIDKLLFGPKVIGVSLLSACLMRFQRKVGETRYVYEIELSPRSMYILSGEARYKWQHSIPPVKSARYSITFRTLK